MIKLWCVCWRQLDSAQHISLNWQLSWYGHDVMTTWNYGHYRSRPAVIIHDNMDTMDITCHHNIIKLRSRPAFMILYCHDVMTTWNYGHYMSRPAVMIHDNMDTMDSTCHHNIIKPTVIIQFWCSMSWYLTSKGIWFLMDYEVGVYFGPLKRNPPNRQKVAFSECSKTGELYSRQTTTNS